MQPLAARSIDVLLRGPVQGTAFADMGVPSGEGAASDTGGSIGDRRGEALKSVPGNRIAAPSTGGQIARPREGAIAMEEVEGDASMDGIEAALSRIAALMQKFAEAQDMVR